MPKRKAATAFQVPRGTERSRRERERRRNLMAVGIGAIAILVALVIVGVGYYDTYVRPPRETALKVGDTSFSMRYFAKRLEIAVAQYPGADRVTLARVLPDLTLEDIAREEIARRAGPDLGVTVTDEDVEQEIADRLGVSRDEADTYDRAFRNDLEQSGLSLDEYRALAEARVYQTRIREQLEADLPATAPQVHVRLVEVRSEPEAEKVVERLDGGEDFAAVAGEVSTHASRDNGGDAGWLARGAQDGAFEEQAFSLPVGARSGVVKLEDGRYWVFQVLEREDDRELTDQQRQELLTAREDDWYREQEEKIGVERLLTDDKVGWALDQAF